jgi:predicted glycoside hydrolase/deacetylase ChbG (UPF0249 family)
MTLGELLGYGPEDRVLVVNADDLGMCRAENEATFEAIATGYVSSTSMMVPCPWAYDAARSAVADGVSVGVHLTLTCEWESYRWGPVTGDKRLCDASGFLPRTVADVYEHVPPEAARAECFAQVERAAEWGVDISHIDSHMGTNQLHDAFFEIYLDVATAFDLPLRMGPYALEEHLGLPQRTKAAARGLLFCDDLVLVSGDESHWAGVLAALRPGVTEVFVHPAHDTPELRAIQPDFHYRVTDHRLVTSPESPLAPMPKVSYVQIRDLQRARRGSR